MGSAYGPGWGLLHQETSIKCSRSAPRLSRLFPYHTVAILEYLHAVPESCTALTYSKHHFALLTFSLTMCNDDVHRTLIMHFLCMTSRLAVTRNHVFCDAVTKIIRTLPTVVRPQLAS